MRTMTHQLAEAHVKFDVGHEEARERLLAILPAASRRPEARETLDANDALRRRT